jgi:RHS repeat-associated protein
VSYENNGNIAYKSDVGSYTYGDPGSIVVCQVNGVTYSPGPHALMGVSGTRNEDYCYDHAGRMIRHGQKTLSYNAFSKTTLIQSADASMAFIYGPERELLQSETTRNNGTTHIKKVMLPGYEHSTTTENATVTKEEKYYLGGHILITVQNGQDAMNQRKEEFLFHDHIGSLVAVTDALGTVTERLSFDPCGRRREWINWLAMTDQDWQTQFQGFTTKKGFTGHEMLDDLGLIHMGGRVYDSTLARFLSTDPVVQQPHNLQNYNRYSYVLNNPVSYTDPTGYLVAEIVAYTVTAIIAVTYVAVQASPYIAAIYFGARELGRLAAKNKFGGELLQIAVIVGCTVATSGAGTPACIAAGSGLAAASVAKANGASNHEALRFGLRTAAVAYVASVMMQGISEATKGGGWENSFGRAYGYGVTSAWASAAMGGDPAAGFTSGFISPFVGGSAMLTGLAAGISSKLAGGKFEHGFMLGAISYLAANEARKTASTPKPNISGSDKVAFVGGAADNTFGAHVVKDQYSDYIALHGQDSAQYFEWTDAATLSGYVAANQGRVTVVAHSYGADEAGHLIAGGMKVYKFVSVDPVGWTRPDMRAISNNSVIWNNYDSTGAMWRSWNNAVATFGGAWNSLPLGYATSHSTSSLDHVSICSMYCRP